MDREQWNKGYPELPRYSPPEKHEIAPQVNNEEGVALTPTELLALLTERIMLLTNAVNKLAKVTMETRDMVNDNARPKREHGGTGNKPKPTDSPRYTGPN